MSFTISIKPYIKLANFRRVYYIYTHMHYTQMFGNDNASCTQSSSIGPDVFFRYAPNVFTYSSLIDRLFKDLALKALAKMLENSCVPNVVTYTEMVDGLCKVVKTAEAYKLTLMMEEKGCNPNVVTYTAMVDGFGKSGKVDKSLELFQEMIRKDCAPNYITYRVLINRLCGVGRLDEAYQLLEEMKQTHWPTHLSNYQKVVEGFSKDFMSSLQLVDEMSNDDSAPLIPVYKVLIDSLQKAGRLDMALQLHQDFTSLSSSSSTHKNGMLFFPPLSYINVMHSQLILSSSQSLLFSDDFLLSVRRVS